MFIQTRDNEFLKRAVTFLAVAVLIAGPVVGEAPPDTTIPRVLNPPLNSDLVNLPGDLRPIPIPESPNLAEFVNDPTMARALGKAFFWICRLEATAYRPAQVVISEPALIHERRTS